MVDTKVILQAPRIGEYFVTIIAECGFYAV